MTLKEKFLEKAFCMCEDESQVDNFVVIANDFAIGFGEWMINNAEKYNEYLYQIQDLKELLEIYKKEKEL